MPPETEIAGPSPEKSDQPETPERVWPRRLKRIVAVASAVILALMLAFGAVAGWYYFHYSRIIDAQMRGGPFRDSVDIYGAPSTVDDGDSRRWAEGEVALADGDVLTQTGEGEGGRRAVGLLRAHPVNLSGSVNGERE